MELNCASDLTPRLTGKLDGMSSSVVIIPRQFFSQGSGGPNKIMAKPGMSSDPNENQTRLRTKATRCGGTHNACFAYKSVLLVCMLVYYYYYPNDHVHSVLKDAKKPFRSLLYYSKIN